MTLLASLAYEESNIDYGHLMLSEMDAILTVYPDATALASRNSYARATDLEDGNIFIEGFILAMVVSIGVTAFNTLPTGSFVRSLRSIWDLSSEARIEYAKHIAILRTL